MSASPEYEGGFDTADGGVHLGVNSKANDENVDLHVHAHCKGFGSAGIYHRLEPNEARELSLALDLAADAAEATAHMNGGLSDAAVSG